MPRASGNPWVRKNHKIFEVGREVQHLKSCELKGRRGEGSSSEKRGCISVQ